MKKRQFVVFAAMLPLVGAINAQTPTRMRGVIEAFDGKELAVKMAGDKSAQVQVDDKAAVVFTQPMGIGEIRPGDFVAVSSMKRDDESLAAFEIRRFPKPSNPGHRPLDGRSDQTMTNATVATMVQAANGHELTVTYEGGTQKIVVPKNASISMLVPGERSQLKPGAPVNLTATPTASGGWLARNIQVGPPK